MKRNLTTALEVFLINMQIIADGFEDAKIPIHFHVGSDCGRLLDVRTYHGQSPLSTKYVYLALASSMPPSPPIEDGSFVILGSLPDAYKCSLCSIIEITAASQENTYDLWELLELIQGIFEKNRQWHAQMQYVLNHDLGISELCKISVDFFQNPLFVHDTQFHILECPIHPAGMTNWEHDARTDMDMLALDVINDFKVDPEYINTLDTVGANIFSANLRGYRILYVNIWSENGRYEGRLCIDEILSSLRPGHFLAAEHFVKMVQIAMSRHNLEAGNFSRPFELILTTVLNELPLEPQVLINHFSSIGWNLDDSYICIKLASEERTVDTMAIISTCNYIETQIAGSYAFCYQDDIVMFVNLTVNRTDSANWMTQLAYIIREGLFQAGVSNPYQDFTDTHYYYEEAKLALQYGKKSDPTIWCHHFSNYVLQYMMDCSCSNFPMRILCSNALITLKEHDKKNETDFYKTLTTYLKNDRRATLTANELFIHRSTLFYRLERIHDIMQIDLENADVRLYISLCLYILRHQEQ